VTVPALGRVGIWSNPLRYHPDRGAVADAAAELEALGYGALWLPDIGGSVLADVEHVLEATTAVPVATGILNIWMHEAGAIARGVDDLDVRQPGRFLLGLGASHAVVVDADDPGRYGRPLSTMRTYLDGLDAADVPRRAPRVLAALGPKMLDLSRDRADGAHPYLVPVEHTRLARERLGPDRLLAPEQAVVLDEDRERGRERARAHVADYLALPNYVANLRRLGFGEDDLRDGGSERLVAALVVWGDEAAIRARVEAHLAAGADHVCLQVLADVPLPLEQWRRIAPAVTG
jgi:probable F420-dependent oxidoreductase